MLKLRRNVKYLVVTMITLPIVAILLRTAYLGQRPPLFELILTMDWVVCGLILGDLSDPQPKSKRIYPREELSEAVDTFERAEELAGRRRR